MSDTTTTIKLLLDNGFAVAFALILLFILFYIIRTTIRYMDEKEKRHITENAKREEKYTEAIKGILEKYEQISEQTTTTIDKITDTFQAFINQNKEDMKQILTMNNEIKNNIENIDKKLDIINTVQHDILNVSKYRNKKKVS